MKNLFFLSLITGLFLCAGFRETQKSLPAWYAGSAKADPSLTKTGSAFSITCVESNSNFINQPVIFSVNGKQDTIAAGNDNYNLQLKPGKYIFQFYLDSKHTEIKTDTIEIAGGFRIPLHINFMRSDEMIICDKPVIYVYPPQTDSVSIQLELKGNFTFTYPQYENGWKFLADPDGTIHMNDHEYQYLFWDGRTHLDNETISWEEGYIVGSDTLVSFFEQKLGEMGMNQKETDDYITYWCPRMLQNETNYIHFMFNDDYNEYAEININPVPDHMLRVFMLWTASDKKDNSGITEQEIPRLTREGFTVVEWGGAQMPSLPVFIYTASN